MVCIKANRLQKRNDTILIILLCLGKLMDTQRFTDDARHRHPWIKRCKGILENDLHVAAGGPQRCLIHGCNVSVLKPDLAACRFD